MRLTTRVYRIHDWINDCFYYLHLLTSGNHTPGIRSYVMNAWADSASTNSYSSLVQRLSV